MTTLRQLMDEDRRLCILSLLSAQPDYQLNNGLLVRSLQSLGHGVSHDAMNGLLAWLEEQGLVTVEPINSGLKIARITRRGLDVAEGRALVPGVRRPDPI
mgnify:CR=1 FL=1